MFSSFDIIPPSPELLQKANSNNNGNSNKKELNANDQIVSIGNKKDAINETSNNHSIVDKHIISNGITPSKLDMANGSTTTTTITTAQDTTTTEVNGKESFNAKMIYRLDSTFSAYDDHQDNHHDDQSNDVDALKSSLKLLSQKLAKIEKEKEALEIQMMLARDKTHSDIVNDPTKTTTAVTNGSREPSLSTPAKVTSASSSNHNGGPKPEMRRYLQIGVVWTMTALILFVIAEHQLQFYDAAVLYGALLTLGAALFSISVPAIHFAGQYVFPEYRLIMPFEGGLHFVVFQALAWAFYAIGLILISLSLYYAGQEKGVLAASGVIAVLAQSFMVSSLLTFKPTETRVWTSKRKRAFDQLNNLSATPSIATIGGSKQSARTRRATMPIPNAGSLKTVTALAEDHDDTMSDRSSSSVTAKEEEDETVGVMNHSRRLSNASGGVDSYFGDDDASSIVTSQSGDEPESLDLLKSPSGQFDAVPFNSLEVDSLANPKDFIREETLVSQFVQMNFVLVLIGVILAYISEHTNDTGLRMAAIALSLTCCIVAIVLTHGVGGMLKHGHKGWRFSQMFQGGTHFVMIQIFAWSLFGLALVAVGSAMVASVYFGRKFVEGSMYIGGGSFLAAELLLIFSLSIFKSKTDIDAEAKKSEAIRRGSSFDETKDPVNYRPLPEFSYLQSMFALGVVAFFSNTQYISFLTYLGIFMLPFVLPKWSIWSWLTFGLVVDLNENPSFLMSEAFTMWYILFFSISSWVLWFSILRTFNIHGVKQWVLLMAAASSTFGTNIYAHWESPGIRMLILLTIWNLSYIWYTYPSLPEINGRREWKGLRETGWLYKIFEDYFGLQIILSPEIEKVAHMLGDKNAEDPRLRQIILGFHPHGIFPTTHIYLSSTSLFRKYFPNLHVNPMVATIIHLVPVMRDVAQWAGVVDVSKKSLHNMFDANRNVQLVIGGQTEMFESKSYEKEIIIVRKRRTAIFREAIKYGLPIIPVFSFGETLTFDNIYLPTIQAWFKSVTGIPIPFIPYGRFYLPIPRRRPITVAFGNPVFPVRKCDHPTEEEIVDYQTRYFASLEVLFETYKSQCGHGEHTIKWKD